MPNKKNIERLISAIEAEKLGDHPYKFDMRVWLINGGYQDGKAITYDDKEELEAKIGADCGTAACIGGTLETLLVLEGRKVEEAKDEEFAEWLGLTVGEAQALFVGPGYCDVTKDEALAALRYVADGGYFGSWVSFKRERL